LNTKRLSKSELQSFTENNQLLFGRPERPEMMLTSKQEVIKFFYQRKFISTSLLSPQAERFNANSIKLKRIGITAPEVSELIFCPDMSVHVAVYRYLKGTDLRTMCSQNNYQGMDKLPSYMASLHEKGIFFRAIHLGNILLLNGNELALVDIVDMTVSSSQLSTPRRARNIAHLFKSRKDKKLLEHYGLRRFLDTYHMSAKLTGRNIRWLEWLLKMSLSSDQKSFL